MEMHDYWTGASLCGLEDSPSTADDIDLERVVWDPAYRSAIKTLLVPGLDGSRTAGGR